MSSSIPAVSEAESSQQPPARRGMPGSVKSMVWSMLAVLAACLLWLAFTPRVSSVQHPVADVVGIAQDASKARGWDVAYADHLPEAWQPVNVRMLTFDGQQPTWQAGYDGPKSAYVTVLQTKGGTADWQKMQVGHGTKEGTVTLAGAMWTRYNSDLKSQKSLVRAQPLAGLDTIVTGKGDWSAIETFAAAVKPRSQITK